MPVELNQAARTNFGNAAQSVRMAPSNAFWRGESAGTFGAASGVLMCGAGNGDRPARRSRSDDFGA